MRVKKCRKNGKPAYQLGGKGPKYTYNPNSVLSMKRAFGKALRKGKNKRKQHGN